MFLMNWRKYLQSDGSSGFLRAARSGHLERVLEFLKSNTDINICNANGLNALHLASKEGHVAVVRELVNRGANTDAATKKGNTALHIASLAGQEEVVKLLVQNNATVNVQSQNGFTPLYMAAQENHDSVVRYLLANGANQSLATEDGFTPLAVALQQGHDKVVAVLLENDTKGKVRLPALHIAAKKDDTKAAALLLQNEHNPDVTSKSGFTPLHIAAHYGNENIAALLLQRGADVNFAAKHNITPLHVAAKWGKANMVTTLLEMKANIEAKTRDGLTPLHCAARSGHDSVVDMLLLKGAPLTAKTKNGLAPLHMASQGDHVDSARILLYNKAPVDDVTVDYLTALHVAAHCGHVRVAKMLLDRQADPNARALNGFTPLHIACKKNRMKVVELLLKHGASIEATTESGLTPLHVASFMGCMNIVIYLIQHGSNPDTPTVRGETPLHLAARANQTDIIRILLRNGAMVDARAREQQTPLHISARLGNVDIVVLLLQHGAAVDATTKDLYTALHIAAKEGQEEVAQVLVEHQASLSATTKKGFTPLHLAAKYGNLKVARLLQQRDAPVDAEGRNGVTPLHVAAHYDNQNVALLLLDKGASPHAAAKNGYTPLHIAAKKNQMDIATTLLEFGANTKAESRAGFTPLHLSAQEGHTDMCSLLLEHQAKANSQAKNGLTPLHLCAQEDRVNAAAVLLKAGAEKDSTTKAGYTPLHVACHFGQMNMVRFLLRHQCDVNSNTKLNYTPLHQAAQQGHTLIVSLLLENDASPNAVTNQGQTPLSIAQKLGYISVVETLKVVTETTITTTTTTITEEKYRVLAPETMHETFLSDSEDEGGDDFLDSAAHGHPTHAQHVYLPYYEGQMLLNSDDHLLVDASYQYLNTGEMQSLHDGSLNIDVTKDERLESRLEQSIVSDLGASPTKDDVRGDYPTFTGNYPSDNVDISHTPVYSGFLVSFMVDARGGAMRGCRHSGVRVIIPPRKAASPMRITCRYLKKEKVVHPPPLMEGEALASRILEMGPSQAKFLGPVIIEVPHFASLRGKEREITILRSDNGETWREHTLEASEEAVQDVLNDSFDGEELNALEDLNTNRITRILTTDFPQYFAIVTRVRQEIHAIGPEGGMVSSTVVPQVQAVFPQGALTKKIKVGLQAQPIHAELVAKLLGNRVAVSPIVTVEPRRRKFHKPITLTIPVPKASSKGMINEYSGDAPTLRLLCSITGGPSRAQWEDVSGSTPLTFVNECVSFTTTVSARFWLIDCRNIGEATKMATDLYREAIHVPFMAKFVVFSKRHDPMEAALRVFCMTDDKEDKTLEVQEHFQEVAKSRDVEVLEAKPQYVEFAGNLVPVTKSGEQLKLSFFAFRENRLPFIVRIRDPNSEPTGRIAFMREPKVGRGEPPQTPICNLNLALPAKISPETISQDSSIFDLEKKYGRLADESQVELIHKGDLQVSDLCNLLGPDWIYLARQLEIPESDINTIECEYQNDTAKQAQVMIRLWMTRAGNRATGNTLEKALSSIGREDIMKQCLVNVELVTDDMEKAVAETCIDQSGFDELQQDVTVRREGSLDVSYDEQDMIKESESAEEASSSISSATEKTSQKLIHHDEKKDKEKSPTEEKAIEKVIEREIVEVEVAPEHEKGAWEEPEKEVEEKIIPEKRTSSVVSDDEKAQRPKHELLEELGKELGRLDSSFVPKTTQEDPEVLGQLAVEEEMIIKERKGARSPTTEQIEVFPEQLDQSSSGADTSRAEAACLGESDTWQSDDLEKAVDRLETEDAAHPEVAVPAPATQQTNARLYSGVAGEETDVDEQLIPSPLKESPASASVTHFSPEEIFSKEIEEEISPAFEYPIGLTADNSVNVGVSPTEEGLKRRQSKEKQVWAEKSDVEEKEEGVEENIRPYSERKQFWEKMSSFSEKDSEKRARMMKRSMTDTSGVESQRTETESDTDTTMTDSTVVEQRKRYRSVDLGDASKVSGSDSEPSDGKVAGRSPPATDSSTESEPSNGPAKGKGKGFVYDNSAFIGAEHIDERESKRAVSPFEVVRSDSDDTLKDSGAQALSRSPDVALKTVKEKTSIFEAEIQRQQEQAMVTQTIKSEIFSSELHQKMEPGTQEEKHLPTDGSPLEEKSEPLVSAQLRSHILLDQLNQPIEDQSPERKSLAFSDSIARRVGARSWSSDTMDDVDAELESEVIIRPEKQDVEILEKDFRERPPTLPELPEDDKDRLPLESEEMKPSSPILMPEQQFQDTVWEVTVQSQQTPKEETTHDIPPESQVLVEKPEEEDEETTRRLSPTEARRIANEIVSEVKTEAEKIAPLKAKSAIHVKTDVEESRKKELIESVSLQKVETLRKKMQGHDMPSVDITDEDLRSGDLSPVEKHTQILEQLSLGEPHGTSADAEDGFGKTQEQQTGGKGQKEVRIETSDFHQESSVTKEEKHSTRKISTETVTTSKDGGDVKKEEKKVVIKEDSSLVQKEKEKDEVKAKVVFSDDTVTEDISSRSEKSVAFKKDEKVESDTTLLEDDRKTKVTESTHSASEGKQEEEQTAEMSVRFTDDLHYFAKGSETKKYSREEKSSEEYKLKSETEISPDSSASIPLPEEYSSGGEKVDSHSESEKAKEEVTKVHHKREVHLKQEVESSSSGSKEELVVLRPKKVELRVDDQRKSALDGEAYSSSGESYYHSFEQTSSRPMSSDVEGLVSSGVTTSEYDTARSYEYETAATSQDVSTSQDYQTAISSMSSRDSMKSVDSESSGHLGSLEVSETSETLVPSAFEVENEQRDLGTPVPDEEVGDAETVPLITTQASRVAIMKEEASSSDEAQAAVTPPANLSSSSTPVMPSTPKPKGKRGAVPYVVLSSESQEAEEDSDHEERGSSPFEFVSDAEGACRPDSFDIPEAEKELFAGAESHMKRSQEMTFYPEPKLMADEMEESDVTQKGSESISSVVAAKESSEMTQSLEASGTSEQLSALTMSATSEQFSDKDELKMSTEDLDQAVPGIVSVTSTGTSTPTEGVAGNTKSMTMIMSSIPSSTGGQTVSTQITSAIYSPTLSSDESSATKEGSPPTASEAAATVVEGNVSFSNGPVEVDYIPEYDDNASKSQAEGGLECAAKEARDDEKKDIDESEKECFEPEVDQGFHALPEDEADAYASGPSTRLLSESSEPELAALIGVPSTPVPAKFERPKTPEPSEDLECKDDTSEFSSEAQASVAELEQEYHGALSRQKPEQEGREKHELETGESASKEKVVVVTQSETSLGVDRISPLPQTPGSRSDVSDKTSETGTDQGREYVVNDVGNMLLEHPEFDVQGEDIIPPPPSMADPVTGSQGEPSPRGDSKYFPEDSDYSSMATEEMTSISPVGKRMDENLEQEQQWMEMQFDDASKIYGFQMEFEREPPSLYPQPLEDIEEEKEELADRKDMEHLKDSLSSTPEYDVLAGRKYFVRTGESDTVSVNSVNSLQEFEKLEKELALESIRKRTSSTGSQDSLNGKRVAAGRGETSSVGSASSLNEFEILEKECAEAEKIEDKAKADAAMLSEIEEGHESQISESESCETLSDHGGKEDSDSDDYEQRMVEIDEIIKQAQTNVESFEKGVPLAEIMEPQGSGEGTEETSVVDRTDSIGREEGDADSLEEAQLPDLELDLDGTPVPPSQESLKLGTETRKASTDSLDSASPRGKVVDSSRSSQDSLELKHSPKGPDVMQGSADSLEQAKAIARGSDVMQTSTDSLETKVVIEGDIMQGSTDSLEAKQSSSKSDPMQASTDSLEIHTQEQSQSTDAMTTSADSIDFQQTAAGGIKSMTASSDSLEPAGTVPSSDSVEKTGNKMFTLSSIESGDEDSCKRGTDPESESSKEHYPGDDSSSGRDGDLSSSGREDQPRGQKAMIHRDFYSSNESLEITSSGATNATWQETESGMSASITSAESATLVSSTDTLDADYRGGSSPFGSPYGSLPSEQESQHQRMYTESYTVTDKDGATRSYHKYMMYPEDPKVSESSQPCEEEDFSHTIKKTVQMPADVRKVTFTGPDASAKMKEFVGKFEPGEDIEEQEEVDEFGNVHIKKVVRKKIVLSGDVKVTDPETLAELERVAAQELEGDVDEQVVEATDEFGTVRRVIKRTVVPEVPEPEVRTTLSETEEEQKTRDSSLMLRLSGSETVLTTSDSSSPDSQQMMKGILDYGEQGESVEEHEEVDEHGNVHIKRTIHKRVVVPGETVTLSGPGAAEQFDLMARDRDVKEEVVEEVDEHGNVRKFIKRTLVKPEVQTVTFSGPDAEEQMKKFLASQGDPTPSPAPSATSDRPLGVAGAEADMRMHEQQGDQFESHQHTTEDGASVHTTQYTTPDGTTVRTTHTRVVSGPVSSTEQIITDVISEQEQ